MKTTFRKFLKVFAPLMLVVFAIACFAGVKLSNSNLSPVQAEQLVETQASETDGEKDADNLGLEKWEDYAQEQIDSGVVPSSFTKRSNTIVINGTTVQLDMKSTLLKVWHILQNKLTVTVIKIQQLF